MSQTSGKVCLASERFGNRNDIGAVDHLARVLPEHRQLRHRRRKRAHHVLLVVHVRLPQARRARVARELAVGLQPDLAAQGRHDLADIVIGSGEAGTLEQHLKEYLGVEVEGGLKCGVVSMEKSESV